jgi:hypothetical protein
VSDLLLPAPAEEDDSEQPECSECYKTIGADDGGLCEACRKFARSGNQLAGRMTPAELVAIYQQAERDVRQGFGLVAGAMESINAAFTLDKPSGIGIQRGSSEYVRFDNPDSHLKEVRRALWHTMVERLEVRRLMSVKAWAELNQQIDKGEVPELTEEAIAAMVKQFSDAAPAMLEQAVAEVFDFLRPPHSDYKRNSEYEVPRRVALTWVIDTWHTKTFPSKCLVPRYQCEQQLTALENVFQSIDGRGSVSKGHISNLSEAIRKTARGALGQTEYFSFRGYNNGALHLEFLREDLLWKFNQIAGGARLRPVSP